MSNMIDFEQKRREIAAGKLEDALQQLGSLSDEEILYGIVSCGDPNLEEDRERARPLLCELERRSHDTAMTAYYIWCTGITPRQLLEIMREQA